MPRPSGTDPPGAEEAGSKRKGVVSLRTTRIPLMPSNNKAPADTQKLTVDDLPVEPYGTKHEMGSPLSSLSSSCEEKGEQK